MTENCVLMSQKVLLNTLEMLNNKQSLFLQHFLCKKDSVYLFRGAHFKIICVLHIDIERRKNRFLKFCYVPTTSAAHNRLLFILFLLRPFTVLMKQTRQAV